jgi:tetratricopeptide (TPR) repeat protein
VRRRGSVFALLPAVGVALVLAGAFFSPWLARRYATDALAAAFDRPAHAVTLADRAHSLDPLLVEPLWAKALAADTRNQVKQAFRYYVEAVDLQPRNAQTWRAAGQYAWDAGCPFQAWKYLERYTELDQKARKSAGGDIYEQALIRVNARRYTC